MMSDVSPGATGIQRGPKVAPDDQGELRAAVGYDKDIDKVLINFGTKISWLAATPEEALEFGMAMIRIATNAIAERGMK